MYIDYKHKKTLLLVKQTGSVTFFVAFLILPVLFFLFSLSLDVSTYYTKTQRAQQLIDAAAMLAYKFLPSSADAKSAAENFLKNKLEDIGGNIKNANVSATADNVSIYFKGTTKLSFASFFGINANLPYTAYAETRSVPLDIFLAIDTSSYLAPEVLGGVPWGDSLEWPAADFFKYDKILYKVDPLDGVATSVAIDPRLSTQQCFNPVLSAHKRAAIDIYDYLSSFTFNSLGLGFYPGQVFAIDLAREVVKPGKRADAVLQPGESDFDDINGSLYNSNVFCAAVAERENHHLDYTTPSFSSKLANTFQCPGNSNSINPINWTLEPQARDCMKSRDAIWSRAINAVSQQRFDQVLDLISSSLITTPSRIDRGGLIDKVPKIALILAGDLPRIDSSRFPEPIVKDKLAEQLRSISANAETYATDYSIYLILYKHQGVIDVNWDSNLSELGNLFQEFNQQHLSKGHVNFKVIAGNDPQQVMQEIVSLLLISRRAAVLSA